MDGRAAPGELQEPLFRLRRGDPRERPDLGVGQLAARERLADARQVRQRTSDAHALVGGAPVHADPPGQPVGAGLEAIGPAAASVELTNEIQKPGDGDFDVGGELSDLISRVPPTLPLKRPLHRQQREATLLDGPP